MADKLTTALDVPEYSSAPSSPGSGFHRVYAKSDGKIYSKNSAGTEYDMTAGSGTALTVTQNTGTLVVADWSLVSGLYELDLADVDITSTSVVDIIPDNADIDTVKDADVLPKTVSASGSVKVYATNLPAADIGVTVNIWK